jgi:transglutaminase-like putative cysteine protease
VGVVLFLVATVVSVYWLTAFYRSLSSDLPPVGLRRRSRSIDYLQSLPTQPRVTPVDEAKIPERLPPIELAPVLPIVAPTAPVDRVAAELATTFIDIPSKTEESLLFRALTLALFAISVISVDLAAGTYYGWLGIPFVTMGTVWSWHRRYDAQRWLNRSVSVASLAVLFGFLVPMLVSQMHLAIDRVALSNKTSVTLALALGMLLVSLQMGLSFHLYNRRLLGYCLVTSGLLMGVAASLSQGIAFLLFLSGFIAIAVPTLMLDYRSRLALKPIGIDSLPKLGQLSYRALPWQYLTRLAAISIGLGLILSVFLPNFHLPDLALRHNQLERQPPSFSKDATPNVAPQSPLTNPPPALNPTEVATKVLGQPGNHNYPDAIKQTNLQLPPELASQLQQFTHKILATSPQPLDSDFARAAYLAEYLKQHHQADPNQLDPTKLPPLDPKLVQQLISQCTTAPQTCKLVGNKQDLPVVYTSMLRSIGIPARLKADEKLAQIDPHTQMYSRPTGQSQSQTEVYFPNWGWFDLDSTPDRPAIDPNSRQLAQLQEQAQQIFATQPSPSTTPPPSPNTPTSSPNPSSSSSPSAANSPPPPDLPKWQPNPAILRTMAIVFTIGAGIAWYLWHRQQQQQQLAKLPPIERIYRSMLVSLSKTGRSKLPTQTQLEYAHNVKNTEHPQIAKVVAEISLQYTAWRYGKQRVDVKQLTNKLNQLHHLQQLAAKRQRQQWFAQHKVWWKSGNIPK